MGRLAICRRFLSHSKICGDAPDDVGELAALPGRVYVITRRHRPSCRVVSARKGHIARCRAVVFGFMVEVPDVRNCVFPGFTPDHIVYAHFLLSPPCCSSLSDNVDNLTMFDAFAMAIRYHFFF